MRQGHWRAAAFLVSLASFLSGAARAGPQDPASIRRWQEDLAFLQQKLVTVHPEPFHSLSEKDLDRMLSDLRADLPRLSRNQVILRISKILASLGQGDGHSGLSLRDPRFGFHIVPLGFYWFTDGVFVKATGASHREARGARLVAVGRTPVEEALSRILEITEGDNAMTRRAWSMRALAIPEVLEALGIVESGNLAEYRLRKPDGGEVRLRPAPVSLGDKIDWIDAGRGQQTPLYLRHAVPNPYDPHALDTYFWYEYLPAEKLLYVNYSAVADSPTEKLADFFRRVFALADGQPIEKFVLDIRNNGGGNNSLNRPILHGMIKRDETIGRPGHFFVIIGRNTFSAAQNLATQLGIHTSAIFVGEPTGGSPNHFGDATTIVLPNSGVPIRIATLRWQDSDPRDRRPWVAPQIAAELSSADYFAGRDPALAAVRTYEPVDGLPARLRKAALQGGKKETEVIWRSFHADPRNKYAESERDINRLGYELLAEKNPDAAIIIFELNTEAFPGSWNAWDSLGEALAGAGRRQEAIRSYQRALELNSIADSAIDALKRLRSEKD
jgi:hypothetical protein